MPLALLESWIEAEFEDYGIVYLDKAYERELLSILEPAADVVSSMNTIYWTDIFGQLQVVKRSRLIGYRVTNIEAEQNAADFRFEISKIEERRKHNMEYFQKEKG